MKRFQIWICYNYVLRRIKALQPEPPSGCHIRVIQMWMSERVSSETMLPPGEHMRSSQVCLDDSAYIFPCSNHHIFRFCDLPDFLSLPSTTVFPCLLIYLIFPIIVNIRPKLVPQKTLPYAALLSSNLLLRTTVEINEGYCTLQNNM